MKISSADILVSCENCKLWKPIYSAPSMGKGPEQQGSCMLVDNDGRKVRGVTNASYSCDSFEEGQFDPQEFRDWYKERFEV